MTTMSNCDTLETDLSTQFCRLYPRLCMIRTTSINLIAPKKHDDNISVICNRFVERTTKLFHLPGWMGETKSLCLRPTTNNLFRVWHVFSLYAFIVIGVISILGCNAPLKQVISSTPHCANNVQLVSLGLIQIKNIKFVKSNNDERRL